MDDQIHEDPQLPDHFDLVWIRTIAEDSRMVAYRPAFRKIAGSVTAAILLQQILYRWANNGCKPFYKYKEACDAADCRPGDSWCEELAFSRDEFDGAIKRIGQKVSRKVPKDSNALVWYWTMQDRKTWYELNYTALRKAAFPVYVERENPDTKTGKAALDLPYTKNTSKNTSKKIISTTTIQDPIGDGGGGLPSPTEEEKGEQGPADDNAALQARRKQVSTLSMRNLIIETEKTLPTQWLGINQYLDGLTMKATYELCKWLWAWRLINTPPDTGGLYDPALYQEYEEAKTLYEPLFADARRLPALLKDRLNKQAYIDLAPADEDALKVHLRDRTDELLKQESED